MKKQKRKSILLALATGGIFLLVTFSTNLSAFIYLNNSDISFRSSGQMPRIAFLATGFPWACSIQMSNLVISKNVMEKPLVYYVNRASRDFINSYSNLLSFIDNLEVLELNTVDYQKIHADLDKTIESMKKTKQTFNDIIAEAEKARYDMVIIERLKKFKYDAFCRRNQLRKDIFKPVKIFLKKGDIRGAYKKALSQFDQLLALSKDIRSNMNPGISQVKAKIWRLNQQYFEAMLFGQYVAQVFGELITQGTGTKI